jgi:peptidyl-prolyl cis-trans isomerase D
MIKFLRNFTKKKFAGLILIIVIVIAFGLGGFGNGFNIGNQNNIAKINSVNISTQDFMDYLNRSRLSQKIIKENIDKNILEELLSSLISGKLLELEIKDLNLEISEETLIKKIKKNKTFLDENGIFQRTLYEKFLLENQMSAPAYEIKMKNNLQQKQLFTYISGGIKSPKFLTKKYYLENNRKLFVDYINLNKSYKSINDFSNTELSNFVTKNSLKLKQDFVNFSYVVITPKNLIGLNDFNELFFDKIDKIENKISKGEDFEIIASELNLPIISKKNYVNFENKDSIENKIYNLRENKTDILEDNGQYIFYQINNIETKLPDLNNKLFIKQIKNLLYQKEKFEFNKNILDQINEKSFNQVSFEKLGKDLIKKVELKSIKDQNKFEINSIELLYSLPVNSFTLVTDKEDNIYLAKVLKFKEQSISDKSDVFKTTTNEAGAKNRNGILKSYDYFLSNRYNIVINEKTLERVKNYFK